MEKKMNSGNTPARSRRNFSPQPMSRSAAGNAADSCGCSLQRMTM